MDNREKIFRTVAVVLAVIVLLQLFFSTWFGQPELADFLTNQGSGTGDSTTIPSSTNPSQTEPSTEVTFPSTEVSEPSTEASQPTTEPSEPSTKPTEPSTKPTEPSTEATKPTTEPSEPSTEPPKPTTKPTESSTAPSEPSEPTEPTIVHIPSSTPSFSAADTKYFSVNNNSSYSPKIQSLLTQGLTWNLTGSKPTILIVHTHGTEAYTPTADSQYKENGGEYRTYNNDYNMISIGDRLTELLEAQGFTVIHDRTPHDKGDYNKAYKNSRAAIKKWIEQYPSITMVLDLHRDAAEDAQGNAFRPVVNVNGKATAKMMMVISSGHSDWTMNLSVAEKFSALINRTYNNLMRPIFIKGNSSTYNQDFSIGSLLVEVGAQGNTHQEALNAMEVLAEAIVAMSKGSK